MINGNALFNEIDREIQWRNWRKEKNADEWFSLINIYITMWKHINQDNFDIIVNIINF